MSENENLLLIRRMLDAFQAGDMATLAQIFAKDVVWRVPGKSFLAGEYRGQDEVFGLFGRLMALTNGTFQVASLDMFANDRGGVLVDRLTAARDGRTLDMRVLLHVSIQHGRIVEGIDSFHPEYAWDEFWS